MLIFQEKRYNVHKIKIDLVNKEEKYQKIKLVKPNILFNRADIKFNNDFELLQIQYKNKIKYLSFHIHGLYCYLGLYMMDLTKDEYNAILKFIYEKFSIDRFYIIQSLNKSKDVNKTVHWLLTLPDSQEEFDKQFSSRSRYNRRSKRKKLEKNYNCKFEHYQKSQLTENLLEKFLVLKRNDYETAYSGISTKDLLSDFYGITDVYTLTINDSIAAYLLYSIYDNHDAYQVNLAYDHQYSKYSIGEMLYYYGIEEMIKRKIKKVYLGGGEYDYKANSKAIKTNTYEGYFTYTPLLRKLFSYKSQLDNNGRLEKFIYFMGLKIYIQKSKLPTNNYLDYFKTIKLEKHIKHLSKINKNKKIVLYGAGLMAKQLLQNYDLKDLNIIGVCDRGFANNKIDNFYGYKCITPQELETIDFDSIYVLISRYDEIIKDLKTKYYKVLKRKKIKPFLY